MCIVAHAFVLLVLCSAFFAMAPKKSKARASKVARTLGRSQTDQEVTKAIHDNLQDMSNTELYGNVDKEGKNAVTRLAERKRAHRANPKEVPMGSLFYEDWLVRIFVDETRVNSQDIRFPLEFFVSL